MEQYNVTGMSCAACSAKVEKAVSGVPGVTSCSVNLLTGSMNVEGSAPEADIIKAVSNAGYGASKKGASKVSGARDALEDTETPRLIKRLVASLILLLPLMYLSMGHSMFGAPLPPFLEGNVTGNALAQMMIAALIMVINQRFFINGFRGVIHGAPNMDTLVALGSGVSFIWSTVTLFGLTASSAESHSGHDMPELWFESAAMILVLITVGKTLEAYSKGRTTDALKSLMDLAPETACVERDGKEIVIPAAEVVKGDIFIVRPGDSIPADGKVIGGHSAVNESALTGESIPVDKSEGDTVSAATVNTSGLLRCEAVGIGEDTALARIIKTVSDAAASKAPVAKTADKVAGIFVPAVMAIAIVTLVIWLIVGADFSYALARAVSVLVISCPCALGLATPVAIMVGSGVGAKNSILFKTAVSLEETGKVQIAALDKTGTITSGTPSVTDIVPFDTDENELLTIAAALEKNSEHPLAAAVMRYAAEKCISVPDTDEFEALSGSGVTARLGGNKLYGGNMLFIGANADIPEEAAKKADELAADGKTPLFFSRDGELLGMIAAADTIRDDSATAIAQLKAMGIRVVMLTGDNKRTAEAIGKRAGVDEVIAGVLPDGKDAVIRGLRKYGRTAMIGDGINDAPALTRADTGIAIGAGTDVAIDAADVVLMKSSLSDAAAAIRLSRAVLRNIKQNLFWAFIYNIIGIPLAAGVFISITGWELEPMFGAAAMSLSSFCVVMNALRLNLFRPHDPRRDRPRADALSEDIKLDVEVPAEKKTILHISGMMCEHCEATVKKVLEKFPEVISAEVSHERGTAELRLSGGLTHLDEMREAITSKGYEMIDKS